MPSVNRPIWNEGGTQALGAGNNDGSIDLAKADTGQLLNRVRIAAPGAVGNLTIILYDGAAPTTPISGTMQLNAQPADGFDMTGIVLTTGTLGWRIAGYSSGSSTAYVNVAYTI
jgi:hypothetical protein